MITYASFWQTLKASGESTYTLTHKHNISSYTIHRLRHNLGVTTTTLNDMCRILNCRIEDICEYAYSEKEQLL